MSRRQYYAYHAKLACCAVSPNQVRPCDWIRQGVYETEGGATVAARCIVSLHGVHAKITSHEGTRLFSA